MGILVVNGNPGVPTKSFRPIFPGDRKFKQKFYVTSYIICIFVF